MRQAQCLDFFYLGATAFLLNALNKVCLWGNEEHVDASTALGNMNRNALREDALREDQVGF